MTEPSTDVPESVPEAAVPQVQQLLNERANAVALGQRDIVAATSRQLAALGVEDVPAKPVETAKPDEKPEEKAEKDAEQTLSEARQAAPQGRTAREQQTTTVDTSGKK